MLGTWQLWDQGELLVFAYRYELIYLVECCSVADSSQFESLSVLNFARHVQEMINELEQTDSVAACYQKAAELMQRTLGYDRAFVYRFDPDGHGQVVSDAHREDMEPLLGLWFPAGNIPAHVRELYLQNRVCVLGDIQAPQVPLVPELNPVTGLPLDLSVCMLRSLASAHCECLAKLNVRGMLVVSVVSDEQLWGLIVCYHHTPYWPDPSVCGLCEVFAKLLVDRLDKHELAEQHRAELLLQQMLPKLTELLLQDVEWSTALADPQMGLLDVIEADGLAVVHHTDVRTLGQTLCLSDLWCLLDWIGQNAAQPIFVTNDLPALCPMFHYLRPRACGVLAIRSPRQERSYVLWLRGERVAERTWAYDPNKAASLDQTGQRLNQPGSFAPSVQVYRGRSRPWSRGDLAVARLLRASLLEVASQLAASRQSKQANALRLAQLAIESCTEPIFICDIDGTLQLINPAYIELVGKKALHVDNLNELSEVGYDAELTRLITDAIREGADSWSGEVMIRNANNQVIPVAFSLSRVRDEHGTAVGFIGIHRDLSEHRRVTQERLELERQKQEVARLESLAVLAGGVGHDFNNLLTTIFNYIHLLSNYLTDETALHALQRIEQASRHAADLCRQLMSYAGRAPTTMRVVEMPALIRETVALVQDNLHPEHRIELDIDDEVPPIIGDIVQLRQAVSNLLINASEAIGPKSGTITVGLRLSHDQSQGRQLCHQFIGAAHYQLGSIASMHPCLMLCVHDTGCGISQATLERIFEPFFSTKSGGRGLGLANVVGAIRSHHGKLEIASTLGQGTLMRLWLPITQPTSRGSTANAQSSLLQVGLPRPKTPATALRLATIQQQSGLVLVADDEESISDLLQGYLTSQGFRVLSAQSGSGLLQLYQDRTEPVRLVILDQQLPEIDGFSLAQRLAELDPTLPFLLISGYDFDLNQLRDSVRSAQVIDFLHKPFTMRELDERLYQLLGLKQ